MKTCSKCNESKPIADFPKNKCKKDADHDHATGAVRALLCGPCNQMLGMDKESESVLMGAVSYLKEFGSLRRA